MSNTEGIQKLGELIQDIQFAMLTTQEHDGLLRSRPMTVLEQTEGQKELLFFTAIDTPKVDEIREFDVVNVSFADPQNNRYVSVSGHAWVSQEKALVESLWKPAHKAWFPEGKDSPRLAVLHVAVEQAEYWDAASSKMVQLAGFIKALATGKPARPGAHQRLRAERPPYPDSGYEPPLHVDDKEELPPNPRVIKPIQQTPD